MKSVTQLLDKLIAVFCVFLSIVLVSCVSWQVFSRYVLGTPSTFTDEVARFLFIWVALIGAAYTLGKKRHLAIDLLLSKFEGKPAKENLLKIIINLISLSFALIIMIYGGYGLMMKTYQTGQVSPALNIQMANVYAAIPLSGLFMVWYLITDLIENIKAIKHK